MYTKSMFLNTLKCNLLPTKNKKKIKIMSFLILDWWDFFFLVEVRAFTMELLKTLTFSISKNYFIYFTTVRRGGGLVICCLHDVRGVKTETRL